MVRKLFACAIVVALLLILSGTLHAQTTSSLSGTVIDATTSAPLSGATVQVFVHDTSYSTGSDEQGRFRLAVLPTGIHRVRASYVGYRPSELPEVWVRSGKEEMVELALASGAEELDEVLIRVAVPQPMATISSHTLTVEQTLRYPATFFDPARLMMSYSGVASVNDQANHFSVRGNGPASNAWLLEGAEIVNPNHLSNAGTQSDYPTLSGGGTTILSAQMLGTSRLLMGGMSAAYGNALGGIMDMRLRRGATDGQAFTVQAGLIGIDLSAEGPFRKGGKASYLVNYRYSTLGLLGAMGVELGDEALNFQDLSFHVSVPIKDKGLFTLFGMGGTSSNRFDAKDSTEWEYDKDSKNIDYTAMMGAAGMTFRMGLGSKAVWRTTAVISESDQERTEEDMIFPRRGFIYQNQSELNERKITIASDVRGASGARLTYQIGVSAMERTLQRDIDIPEITVGWLVRPYAQGGYAITERLQAELGLAYSRYSYNGSDVVEPRITMRYTMRGGRAVSISAGQRGQLPMTQLFPVSAFAPFLDNTAIGFTRTQEVVLAYHHPVKPHLVLHAEAYVQRQLNAAVGVTSLFGTASFGRASLVNGWDDQYYWQLANKGTALNKGFEVGLDHTFHRGFFYQVNSTLLDARYTDINNKTYDSRWNTRAMGNLVVGREFAKEKEGRKRTWGVNGRINFTGGQRYTPYVDNTIEFEDPYTAQYASTYRLDLRIYLKRERNQHTGMWALDLLNATNAQNVAYQYYDFRKAEVVTKYQLGLIPNLSYRIEF